MPATPPDMSFSEMIAKQQGDLRLKVEHILTPSKSSPNASPASGTPVAAPTDVEDVKAEPPAPPPGMHEEGSGTRRVKKNRNQSAKKNTIKVLDPKDCGGNCNCVQPAMTDTGTGSDVCKQEVKMVHDVEVQTPTTLPDVIRDVMWTPSGIEPVLEVEEDNGILEQGIVEGNAVDDIDNIETEKDAP